MRGFSLLASVQWPPSTSSSLSISLSLSLSLSITPSEFRTRPIRQGGRGASLDTRPKSPLFPAFVEDLPALLSPPKSTSTSFDDASPPPPTPPNPQTPTSTSSPSCTFTAPRPLPTLPTRSRLKHIPYTLPINIRPPSNLLRILRVLFSISYFISRTADASLRTGSEGLVRRVRAW